MSSLILHGYGSPSLVLHGFGGSNAPSQPITSADSFDQALELYLYTRLGVPVWALKIPQSATVYPQIVYTMINESPYYYLRSASGMNTAEYQIDCYGDDKISCDTLANSLRLYLQGFRGSFGTIRVYTSRLENRTLLYERAADDSDEGTYRVMSQYTFSYSESVPVFG